MNRRQVLLQAALLVVLGTLVPVIAAVYVSWRQVSIDKRSGLEAVAQGTLVQVDDTFASVASMLHLLADPERVTCSQSHIVRMRELMIRSPVISGVAASENGFYQCSVWGPFDEPLERLPADFVRPDGIEVMLAVPPHLAQGMSMLGLRFHDDVVFVDPQNLLGYAINLEVSIALLSTGGDVIATRREPDLGLVKRLRNRQGTGQVESSLYAVVENSGWTLVALERGIRFPEHLRAQSSTLLLIGGIAAILSSIVVGWLSRRRLSPLGELTIAVRKREFLLHYQPIVELKTGRCIGAEALVRWRRPDGTMVRPDHFIPLAESSGLIMPITDQVIDIAISELKGLLLSDRSLHIAINLCAADISSGRFLPVLEKALEPTGILPSQVLLEATERGFVDVEGARRTLVEARRRGHGTAIDDFGTGYSSLKYLQTLPLTALKIDKSFVDTIGLDTATGSVTGHIIKMAKELKLIIVAEGVETQAQADYLIAQDVDLAQGWLFSRPLPAEAFIDFCRTREGKDIPHA